MLAVPAGFSPQTLQILKEPSVKPRRRKAHQFACNLSTFLLTPTEGDKAAT